ncbi:hypothetical protein [Oryza sativa Japonica Group]|uniref:Uncharacterized protein n=1 Tax=Oryza sativa subsp. japonica TaxID=39947 RepID=Q94E83_ORYSJ|nr:hypothetical protein [Oryza sativa Japonica Group]
MGGNAVAALLDGEVEGDEAAGEMGDEAAGRASVGGGRAGRAATGEEGRRQRLSLPWAREEGELADGRAAAAGGR